MEVLDRFVAIEGLDGAGTTTQLELVTGALRALGVECYPTREPTDGRYGRETRLALRREVKVHPLTLALLFAADRNEHLWAVPDGIRARLDRGQTVITDRYLFSSLAYQSLDTPFEQVKAINGAFPVPRDVVFVDTPLEVCQARLRERRQDELFDDAAVQREVLEGYRRALGLYEGSGMRVHRIDGARTPKEICGDICRALGF